MSTSPKCGPLDISHAAAVAGLVFYFLFYNIFYSSSRQQLLVARTFNAFQLVAVAQPLHFDFECPHWIFSIFTD